MVVLETGPSVTVYKTELLAKCVGGMCAVGGLLKGPLLSFGVIWEVNPTLKRLKLNWWSRLVINSDVVFFRA